MEDYGNGEWLATDQRNEYALWYLRRVNDRSVVEYLSRSGYFGAHHAAHAMLWSEAESLQSELIQYHGHIDIVPAIT